MNTLSRIALGVSAIALANAQFAARGALKTVEDEPEVIETSDNGGGGDGTEKAPEQTEESTKEEDDAAADFDPSGYEVAETIPDDVGSVTARASAIEWPFPDMPVGAHIRIPKALVQRARGAIQNARTNKGKPNGKVFKSFLIKGNAAAEKRNPGFKAGDIEVWRLKDIAVVETATSSDTENAD